jgi:hypothetical protein
MIWIPATEDDKAMLYTEEGVVLGVVRQMGDGRYIATTNRHYLGWFKLLKNAQKAVETKHNAENNGVIVHAGR